MEAYESVEDIANDIREHPYKKANYLSRLFFTWLYPLFYKGYFKDLTEEDIFPTLKQHESSVLGNKLEKEWQKQLDNKKQKPSLWTSLLKVFGPELLWLALVFAFIELVLRLAQPLILSQLLKYYEPNSTMTKGEAYLYSGLITLSPALVTLFQHNFLLYQLILGVKIKVAASSLVYRKALKLSRSSLAETNVGQMVNLISNDVARFDSSVKHIQSLWLAPLELIIIIVLLYFYVGPTGMTGVVFLTLLIPLQMWLAKKSSVLRLKTALRTDERIRLMNEIVSGIQVIKMYTWEKPFAKLVEIARRKEMQQIQKFSYIRATVLSFHLFVIKLAIYLCVLVYVLSGNIVNAQYVYIITSFYSIIRQNLTKRFPEAYTTISEAHISVKRIESFLMREEIDFGTSYNEEEYESIDLITLKNVSVKWNPNLKDYSLENLILNITLNELVVIIGPVGSGKTTLLNTFLKELPPLTGKVEINGKVSFASQEPWLFMGSIRENILFGQPFNKKRYEEVINVCALNIDLTHFPFGDKTLVGERGVTLSGGQKARINLARAIYRDADIYLLDDPLSAVDAHVGKHIFKKCIQEYLKDKCVVLVTHQLQYLKNVTKIYLMNSGRIEYSGSFDEIQKSGKEYAKLLLELNNKPEEEITTNEEKSKEEKRKSKEKSGPVQNINRAENKPGPKIIKEAKAIGNVSLDVYNTYFSKGGHWCKIWLIFLLFIGGQALSSLSDYYLTWWINAEEIRNAQQETNFIPENKKLHNKSVSIRNTHDILNKRNNENNMTSEAITLIQEFWIFYMTEDMSLLVYSFVLLILVFVALARSMVFFNFCIKASINLHNSMFNKIVYATMRFFNTNPSGRILNRFSNDMNQVDEALPSTMMDSLQNWLTGLATTIVIATVNPWMLIVTVLILVVFYFFKIIYIATSRDVKRIEGVTRSPIYSHLAASLQGLTTIRAFEAQEVLQKEFDSYQDRNSSALILFIALGRCFGLMIDIPCVIYIFLVTMSFLFFKTDTLGGFVGLSITQSLTLTTMFQMCVRQLTDLENQMTCVERIKEYVDIVPEFNSDVKEPPKNWPSDGRITFKDLSLRYAADQQRVLKNLNFSIKSKEKVGIVGRTGAGKSSIITALFRLAENEGVITIDDVDIRTVSLERLRSSIAIIPQEPVLFTGTLRKNLDPFDEYEDTLLWNALEEVELKEIVTELAHGLDSKMSEGGSNFSVGQRQLFCLARAIIKNNKILVLDEATANVDPRTDALIQTTIRKKFADCTVLTIAHRLHTIMDSDKVIVMDAGEVIEFGSPFELLQNTEGVFTGMVEQTGKAMAENILQRSEKV